MRLTFVGRDPESNPAGSPTVYRTDRGSWVVLVSRMISNGFRAGAPRCVTMSQPDEGSAGPGSFQSR